MTKGLIVGLQVWAVNYLNQNNLEELVQNETPRFTLAQGIISAGAGSWPLNTFSGHCYQFEERTHGPDPLLCATQPGTTVHSYLDSLLNFTLLSQ